MNDFDQRIKQRAQQEHWQIDPASEARMERRLYAARPQPKKKKKGYAWTISIAAVAAAAALLLLIQPRPDAVTGALPKETEVPFMVPVTQGTVDEQPEISADFTFTGDTVQMDARMINAKDDDIWLVQCQAEMNGERTQQLIWLEPGAEYQQEYAWHGVQSDTASLRWTFTGYRVTAHTLHWMDGQSHPGDEDYEEDQSLLRDAFAAEALILHPGDWANGQAGEMRLVLPIDQPQEPLSYYIEKGMLTEGCSADETFTVERLP